MASKFRYRYSGGFLIGDWFYTIDIPTPWLYDTEADAMRDSTSYRFIKRDGEVVLAAYTDEKYEVGVDEKGQKCLYTWTVGQPFKTYTYEQFKELTTLTGGLYKQPYAAYMDGSGLVPVAETFNELFPDLAEGEREYIDNEAYFIFELDDRGQLV